MAGNDGRVSETWPGWSALFSSDLERWSGLDASSPADALDEARSMLDKELAALEKATLAARMRRNSFSPIHRLPPEVLSNVFFILSQTYAPRPSAMDWSNLGWITVSHVCRHWRQIALDNPSLWGTNICSHPKWTAQRLTRSKNAPITLEFTSHYYHGPENWVQQALLGMHRVREVALELPHTHLHGIVNEAFHQPAPSLVSLSLASRVSYEDSMLLGNGSILPLPQPLFAGEAPRLRRLVLVDCVCPWEPWLFRNLETLSLSFTTPNSFGATYLPKLDLLLSLLECMAQLHHLELVYAAPPEFADSSSARRITLPSSLHMFALKGEAKLNNQLAHHLLIPPSTQVLVRSTCNNLALEECTQIMPLIRPVTGGVNDTQEPLRSLSIISGRNRLEVRGWRRHFQPADWDLASYPGARGPTNPAIDLLFTWRAASQMASNMLSNVMNGLHVQGITSLSLGNSSIASSVSVETWTHTLSRLSALEGIYLHINIHPFIAALNEDISPSDESTGDAGPRSFIFPNLRRITLTSIDFRLVISDSHVMIDILVDALLDRLSENNSLDILDLSNCCIEANSVKALKEVVPEVIWDGLELHHADMDYDDDDVDDDIDEDYYGGLDDEFDDDIWADMDGGFDAVHDLQDVFAMIHG